MFMESYEAAALAGASESPGKRPRGDEEATPDTPNTGKKLKKFDPTHCAKAYEKHRQSVESVEAQAKRALDAVPAAREVVNSMKGDMVFEQYGTILDVREMVTKAVFSDESGAEGADGNALEVFMQTWQEIPDDQRRFLHMAAPGGYILLCNLKASLKEALVAETSEALEALRDRVKGQANNLAKTVASLERVISDINGAKKAREKRADAVEKKKAKKLEAEEKKKAKALEQERQKALKQQAAGSTAAAVGELQKAAQSIFDIAPESLAEPVSVKDMTLPSCLDGETGDKPLLLLNVKEMEDSVTHLELFRA